MHHSRQVPSLFGPLVSPQEKLEREHAIAPASAAPDPGSEPASSSPAVAGAQSTYVCPGEKHAIPRSIHLARLAAFYPNCRQCEHRHDTGQLPRSMIGRLEETARRVQQPTPFRMDGIRGAYLNQLTRSTAAQIAAAVADRLWSVRPLGGRMSHSSENDFAAPVRRAAGPAVVIAQDSRPSSADLCVGVSVALKRMGCEVIDIGRVNRACLVFAVEHLQAGAGLYVTGSGCPDAWTGLDLVGERGVPWSMQGTLADIERRTRLPIARPTRQGGSHRFFDASVPYRASLLKFYQEVRAVRLLACCSEPTVLDTLVLLLESNPCQLIFGEGSTRASGGEFEKNPGDSKIAHELRGAEADYGVIIDEDGGGLTLLDRDGQPCRAVAMITNLLRSSGVATDTAPIAVGPDVGEESRRALRDLGWAILDVEEGSEAMARSMQQSGAAVGVQAGGRIWFPDTSPRCDAAVTLGRILQTIDADP